MKKLLFPLVTFLLLMSCEEENLHRVDPFVGSWQFSDPQVSIFFDVKQEGDRLNYYNVTVDHPAIPEEERTNNNMLALQKFESGDGYGRIEITSRGTFYYKVSLIYNRFTDEGLAVYDVQVDIPSEPFIVLTDRVFTRSDIQ